MNLPLSITPALPPKPPEPRDFLTIKQLRRNAFEHRLKAFNGNYSLVAESLGVGRATLYRWMKEFGAEK